jgi:hypothetical protein
MSLIIKDQVKHNCRPRPLLPLMNESWGEGSLSVHGNPASRLFPNCFENVALIAIATSVASIHCLLLANGEDGKRLAKVHELFSRQFNPELFQTPPQTG